MAYIRYQKGDIFDSKAQVIVNTVNCKGVMGKGLALAFKQRYPAMFLVYQQECKTGRLHIGKPTLYKQSAPWILNFPTKNDWKFPSRLEYLEKGLEYFLSNYKKAGITSVAFPKLGAQNGKLSWDEVGPLMARYLSQVDIDVYIYIAEDDKEYQYNSQRESDILKESWKQFSEIALSQDHLVQEVQLSLKEAKKVERRRELMEFTSLTDIEAIEGLAKVSLKRVKDYIAHQQCKQFELFAMKSANNLPSKEKKKSSRVSRSRKKLDAKAQISPGESLFPLEAELVG